MLKEFNKKKIPSTLLLVQKQDAAIVNKMT